MPYYAVHKGYNPGVFTDWNLCKDSIEGFKGAMFKKFDNKTDAEYFCQSGIILDREVDNFDYDICVYTDGGCINNGSENSVAGIGIYFGDDDPRNVSERLEGKQTNNTAEMTAILKAYDILENEINDGKKVLFCTDSIYAKRCCTEYGKKIALKGFPPDTINLRYIRNAYNKFNGKNNIQFLHVRSHTNGKDKHSLGNAKADELASKSMGRTLKYNNQLPKRKIYVFVPYDDKDEAKQLGCRWDPNKKKWYYYENLEQEKINKINELFS